MHWIFFSLQSLLSVQNGIWVFWRNHVWSLCCLQCGWNAYFLYHQQVTVCDFQGHCYTAWSSRQGSQVLMMLLEHDVPIFPGPHSKHSCKVSQWIRHYCTGLHKVIFFLIEALLFESNPLLGLVKPMAYSVVNQCVLFYPDAHFHFIIMDWLNSPC